MMSKLFQRIVLVFLLVSFFNVSVSAQKKQELSTEKYQYIGESVQNYLRYTATVYGKITVNKMYIFPKKNLEIHFSNALSEYPIRENDVTAIESIVKNSLPADYKDYNVAIYSAQTILEDLASPFYSVNSKKAQDNAKAFLKARKKANVKVWVENISKLSDPSMGLSDKHIALWQSHGMYYDQKLQRWEWQRARIFQTVEDLYTQSYVVPFLVPMLENAGAYVMMPRERDCRREELVIDNVDNAFVSEGEWTDAGVLAFANPKEYYIGDENPFKMGNALMTNVSKGESKVVAKWIPSVPENGQYAVYVSYVSLPKSTDAATYVVKHNGGETKFSVNQQIGGGTWVFLGTFPFEKANKEQGVYLSNESSSKNDKNSSVVVADAVKIGGGTGNIARYPFVGEGADAFANVKSSDKAANVSKQASIEEKDYCKYELNPQVSGAPRYTEGARYWLQWAGFAKEVYSSTDFVNDYNDDYRSRGLWVNALSGGSYVNPKQEGLKVPVDMSFAFHSDAGTTLSDSLIGTLAIYTRFSGDSDLYPTGEPRIAGRELADLIQTQIVDDVRSQYEIKWPRRGLWDKSYYESRSPEVPAMLLELLSHQNFADMRYGLDPNFRFTVSRAIYKGILKFLSQRDGRGYIVQPLPVENFAAVLSQSENAAPMAKLSWSAKMDPIEPTAVPRKYIVYKAVRAAVEEDSRMNEYEAAGFDNGTLVEGTSYEVALNPGEICSFKVTAVNDGGESFPSEILSVGLTENWKDSYTALVVNGFDRVSAPASFATRDSSRAGFDNALDGGVPYLRDFSYIGAQHEFRREIPWMDDDAPGFGASYGNYERTVVAGNTFDYPYIHGKAILKAGYNFVSSSRGAVTSGAVDLKNFPAVDMIMGKQVSTLVGRKNNLEVRYEVFPIELQKAIAQYCYNGGNLLVSGAYIASDLWDSIYEKDAPKSLNSDLVAVNAKIRAMKAELNELVDNLYKKSSEVSKSNNEIGFDYYANDTIAVSKVIDNVNATHLFIDSITNAMKESSELIAKFEAGADKDMRSREFAMNILKFRWMTHYASADAQVNSVQNPFNIAGEFSFFNKLNSKSYAVENPDAFVPVGENAFTIYRYSDNNISAGVAYKGDDYKSVSLGFPIEALKSQDQIDALIAEIFKFFE